MNFKKSSKLTSWKEITEKYSELEILQKYISLDKIPALINAPYRDDRKPSLGISLKNGKIIFNDFAIGKGGNLCELLKLFFNTDFKGVLDILSRDLNISSTQMTKCLKLPKIRQSNENKIEIKIRDWEDYDLEYWNSYGVTIETLKLAKVLPISYYVINDTLIKADKLAYAYLLITNGMYRYKIYQPYSFKYKWINNYTPNSINLLNRFNGGDKIIIASSLKDAMCIISQLGIPSICPQGEGYKLQEGLILYLKNKFSKIYILLDNDKAGINYAKKMADYTGFTNIELPQFNEGKDVSDYYKTFGANKFKETLNSLIK